MEKRLLVLLAGSPASTKLRKLQHEHYVATGDGSPYTMPPIVILGESKRPTFDRKKYHLPVVFKGTVETPFGFVLSAGDVFQSIQKELGLDPFPTGFFFSTRTPYITEDNIICEKSWRLAMLVVGDDYSSTLLQ